MPTEANPGTGPGPGPGPIDVSVERRVAHVEEISWKKRALEAESALEAAKREIDALTERCATHERNIESVTRARAEAEEAARRERLIGDAIDAHHPIDGALCATLVERELEREGAGEGVDLAARLGPIVSRLAAERPYLFRAPTRAPGGAAMAGAPAGPGREPLEDALEEARASGSRTQLLRYLRLRRGA